MYLVVGLLQIVDRDGEALQVEAPDPITDETGIGDALAHSIVQQLRNHFRVFYRGVRDLDLF